MRNKTEKTCFTIASDEKCERIVFIGSSFPLEKSSERPPKKVLIPSFFSLRGHNFPKCEVTVFYQSLKWMSSWDIFFWSYTASYSMDSVESEYESALPPCGLLWMRGYCMVVITPALSTASSQTAPLRGSSQFIIDHPSFAHLSGSAQDERTRTREREDNKTLVGFCSLCHLSSEDSQSILILPRLIRSLFTPSFTPSLCISLVSMPSCL